MLWSGVDVGILQVPFAVATVTQAEADPGAVPSRDMVVEFALRGRPDSVVDSPAVAVVLAKGGMTVVEP